jgi:hypothetical protein
VTATRCPSKLDHRASGTVLWCAKDRGHDCLHVSADQRWADGDEDVIQGGDACCAGEWGYASPVDMHSDDCPEYLASVEAFEARRREGRERVDVAPGARWSPESLVLAAALRRAITHLRDVAAGRVRADAHTDRIVELGAELAAVLDQIRSARRGTR